jgi:cytochrome c-type biogenesis protein CcmH
MELRTLKVLGAAFTIISAIHSMMASAAAAQTAEEKKLAALSDIRRELACYCSCSLTVEDCLRSMRCSESAKLSEEVKTMFDAGKKKADILQAMVAKYSETILSAPTKKGFNLAAWILPFAAIGLGGIIAAIVIKKWRSQTTPSALAGARPVANSATSETADPYLRQVEEELKKLER